MDEEVLPAYAGMIPSKAATERKMMSAPRVCGDDPSAWSQTRLTRWCSPRMRG